MKISLSRSLAIALIAALAATPTAFAQRSLGKKKGPTSKLYMAEAKGETSVQNGDKIYTARQATAFDAPGSRWIVYLSIPVLVVLAALRPRISRRWRARRPATATD